jgi:hypothetical protein
VLDTGAARATLAIADIGHAELGPQTRVRLERVRHGSASDSRHELFLERGTLHARVIAPPRIFAVATPSAHVTDLGCEYALEVDAAGAGSIRVITGRVELETGDARNTIVVAPAGSRARLLAGRRAGLPLAADADATIAAAAHAFEDAPTPAALDQLLAAARATDAVTIANLARVVTTAAERRRVLGTLLRLVPPPPNVTIEGALADTAALDQWFDAALSARAR